MVRNKLSSSAGGMGEEGGCLSINSSDQLPHIVKTWDAHSAIIVSGPAST